MTRTTKLAASAAVLLWATQASAHGIATAVVHRPDGVFYQGYDPSFQFHTPAPVVVSWSIPEDLDNGYIPPSAYASPDIVCHVGATNADTLEVPVRAGDTLEMKWNQWPESHKGPVITYMADCGGACSEVADKTKLAFFKIAEAGYDAAAKVWASETLMANGLTWTVQLPAGLAPGNYVLRHEMIALHGAGGANGAQNYPFCYNLAVSGTGTARPSGVPATALYKATDPGILFDLYSGYTSYPIPGPALYSGAAAAPAQTKPGAISATSKGVPSYTGAAKRAFPTAMIKVVRKAKGGE